MRRLALHHWILIGMALGAAIGLPLNLAGEAGAVDPALVGVVATIGEQVGGLFLRLLQMIVVPLIFASLVVGVTGLGDPKRLGRLGARTFGYYMGTSALAVFTGLVMVNLFRPGVGVELASLPPRETPAIVEGAGQAGVFEILWQQVVSMVPVNPFAATAEGDMLPIIFFALSFGLAITFTGGEHAATLKRFFEAVFEVMMKMTLFVIRLAPIGVFGFMLYAAAGSGLDAFAALFWYMVVVAAALATHALFTLPMLLFFLGKRNPFEFAKALSPALVTAFSTASSNATLPLTMRCVEERAGVENRISSFVLPLGATINMDGTALYEVVAVLFIAQVYGVELGLAQQFIVAMTALLASVGAAGIPHAGTVMMVVVLNAVGLPVEAVGLILAVDRVLDMGRTAVNVWSDSTATAIMQRFDRGEPEVESGEAPTPVGD